MEYRSGRPLWPVHGDPPRRMERNWSGRRESNPRHQAWEACVLPLNYSRSGPLSALEAGSKLTALSSSVNGLSRRCHCLPLMQNSFTGSAAAEPFQIEPSQAAVAPEPGHLSLRESSRSALDCLDRLFLRETGDEVANDLRIAKALQARGSGIETTGQQPFHLFRPPGPEHRNDATIDALIQALSRPGETDQHRHPCQTGPLLRLPSIRAPTSTCEDQLECAEHSNRVSRLYRARGGRVEATQLGAQGLSSLLLETSCQTGAQGSIHRRWNGEPVDRRRQVQARPTHQQCWAALFLKTSDLGPRQGAETSGAEGLGRIHQVDHMMVDSSTLRNCRLGRPDVQAPVDLPGVDGDDLSTKGLRQLQGQLGLADCCRTDDGEASSSTGHGV